MCWDLHRPEHPSALGPKQTLIVIITTIIIDGSYLPVVGHTGQLVNEVTTTKPGAE